MRCVFYCAMTRIEAEAVPLGYGLILAPSQPTVTFRLEPAGKGTRLSVAGTGFDGIPASRRAKAYEYNNQGWAEVLVRLRDHVERAG